MGKSTHPHRGHTGRSVPSRDYCSQVQPREGEQDKLFLNLEFLWSYTDTGAGMHSCDYKSRGGPELRE